MAKEALLTMPLHEMFEYKNGELYWAVEKNQGNKSRGKKAGNKNDEGYIRIVIKGKQYPAHHIIFAMHNGYVPEEIDHINMDRADNRIENLRPCTRSDNMRNRVMFKSKTDKRLPKNVYKQKNRYIVSLTINKKQTYFGCYEDLELAELIAFEAREKYHGAFVNHGVAA